MIVSVTEILKVVSSTMHEHLAVKNKEGATMHDFYHVFGQEIVVDRIKSYFDESIKSGQFNVLNADLMSLRSDFEKRFMDSTISPDARGGAESTWTWIAEQFNNLKNENQDLDTKSHADDNTISILSELIKEQQNKLRLFTEAVSKLEEWNTKYPPGKVYSYDRAQTIENLLQECVKMLIASKESVAHGDIRESATNIGASINNISSASRAKAIMALMQLVELRDAWNKVDGFVESKQLVHYFIRNTHRGFKVGHNNFHDIATAEKRLLTFKSAETRDKFLETFRPLIEEAKEFL